MRLLPDLLGVGAALLAVPPTPWVCGDPCPDPNCEPGCCAVCCPARDRTYLSEGGDHMGLTKHGHGDLLPDPEDATQKTAKKDWTEDDAAALAKENEEADK